MAITQNYPIGRRSTDKALLRVTPTVIIEEGRMIDKRILGIGNTFKDVNKTVLLFEKNTNVDKDGKLPLIEKSKGSENMYINFDFDVNYYQQTLKNQYWSPLDTMAQLGGAWMFFQLAFGLFTPFVVICFLSVLARMIRDKRARLYREGLEHLYGKSVS